MPKHGQCKLCRSYTSLVRDHDHKTGLTRGFICLSCNLGLGCFKDNKDVLLRASLYLKPVSTKKQSKVRLLITPPLEIAPRNVVFIAEMCQEGDKNGRQQ